MEYHSQRRRNSKVWPLEIIPLFYSPITNISCTLAFPEMSLRGNDIKDEAFGACDWLLLHEVYISWFHQPNGLLWIKGKPGAEESTLIKYALRESQRQESSMKLVMASVFFHGRGAPIQRSSLGLFRLLLH